VAVFAVLTDQLFFGGHVACNSTLALLCHLDTLLFIHTAVNKTACLLFVKAKKSAWDKLHGFTRVLRAMRSWWLIFWPLRVVAEATDSTPIQSDETGHGRFTLGTTPYPPYRRLGGPHGRCGRVRKISPPTGIRSPDRPARTYLSTWICLHVLSVRSCRGTKNGQDKC
jgi:hypothetical protein